MGEFILLGKTHHVIITCMLDTGQAPHFTEIAAALDILVEEGRKAVHECSNTLSCCWAVFRVRQADHGIPARLRVSRLPEGARSGKENPVWQ